jgi:hypothetical protein
MRKKRTSFFKIIANLDIFSKLILITILVIGFYLILNPFFGGNLAAKNKENILEVSKNFSFNIEDYSFQHFSRDRLNDDMYLNVFLKDSLNLDDFNKIVIKISPEQEFEYSLIAENLIQIRFKNEAPLDGKENIIEFLLNNNLLSSIKYKNLETPNSDSEEQSVYIEQ